MAKGKTQKGRDLPLGGKLLRSSKEREGRRTPGARTRSRGGQEPGVKRREQLPPPISFSTGGRRGDMRKR